VYCESQNRNLINEAFTTFGEMLIANSKVEIESVEKHSFLIALTTALALIKVV